LLGVGAGRGITGATRPLGPVGITGAGAEVVAGGAVAAATSGFDWIGGVGAFFDAVGVAVGFTGSGAFAAAGSAFFSSSTLTSFEAPAPIGAC
jgi:hypothetical protein